MPREDVCGAAEAVYDAISRLLPQITPVGTERCLKRYFAYTRAMYMRKRQTYSFDYDYSSLSDAIEDGLERGAAAVRCVLDGNIDPNVFAKSFLQRNF